ncbi:hypothetical protein MKK75_14435 [Methylobacterium sp. J-030]|uniref:hypothetical protein n=1 Tax=Methylobacterium sp. J-030 TaxID=2836627 RepID=UPI001FB89E01|nr:hypothetical protein [Methylobacterium sp. J-030]MCJ2069979.1 hypothetical protein [Methylobacterium sp. J-030]
MDRSVSNPVVCVQRISRLSGFIRAVILVALASSLAACSGDVVRSLASDAGYAPRVVAAPDFVTESRSKAQQDYMPVGVDAPKRPVRAKSVTGQKALEAELESARGRNETRGRAAASAGKGAAATIKPAPAPPQ